MLALRDASSRRALVVLDRASGRPLSSTPFAPGPDLAPATFGGRVALRTSEERIDLFTIGAGRPTPLRAFATGEPVSAPLLFEDELYVRVGDQLVRHDAQRREPVWTTSVAGVLRGDPSLLGEHVFALRYAEDGTAHLAAFERASGELMNEVAIGQHAEGIPSADRAARIVLATDAAFVEAPHPLSTTSGQGAPWARVVSRGFGHPGAEGVAPLGFACAPLSLDGAWIAREDTAERGPVWLLAEILGNRQRGIVLADAEHHPELLGAPPASSVGDVVLLRNLAVDRVRLDVLWRAEVEPRLRPIPIDDLLLVVEGPSTLVALREPALSTTEEEREVSALLAKLDHELGDGLASLAFRVAGAGDAELAERQIDEAVELGCTSVVLERARAALDRLPPSRGRTAPQTAALVKDEAALRQRLIARVLDEASLASSARRTRLFVAAALARDPADPRVIESVAALVPSAARAGGAIDEASAASWLDYLAACERAPIRVHSRDPSARVSSQDALARISSRDALAQGGDAIERVLAREQARWREDLVAFSSADLLVVTPPGRPGVVARALAIGALVERVLEEITAPLGPPFAAQEPMTMLLYETQEEYLAESQEGGEKPELARGWTSGHYSPGENLSRMFLPADDADARRLLGVYAHELTHHWLTTRAPFAERISLDEARPGHWLVEGFATFIEELALDPARGTWRVENPRAWSLDLVASSPASDRLAWPEVFAASHGDFTRFGIDATREIALAWRLGAYSRESDVRVFYGQAAATCHWMYAAENGAHRRALLELLRAAYVEGGANASIERALGLASEEIGRAVVEHARAATR